MNMKCVICHGSGPFTFEACVIDESRPMCDKCASAVDAIYEKKTDFDELKKSYCWLYSAKNGIHDKDVSFFVQDVLNAAKANPNYKKVVDQIVAEENAARLAAEAKHDKEVAPFNAVYEYAVESVMDNPDGSADIFQIQSTISRYASSGWRLHKTMVNEIGRTSESSGIYGYTSGTNAKEMIWGIICGVSLDRERNEFDRHYAGLFDRVYDHLLEDLAELHQKVEDHPEMYLDESSWNGEKSLLDALYEEGLIPTYSFPKDVVSTYIEDESGKILQQVERGLDIAISEYAPGRSIVVDKRTYLIGGLYVHQGRKFNFKQTEDYLKDPNFTKDLKRCPKCEWFGYANEVQDDRCPFCGYSSVQPLQPMVRPWGFSPKDNRPEADNVVEVYSATSTPLYSTLPDESGMEDVRGYVSVRKAVRQDQRIILLNRGILDKGFTICRKCGAVVPGDDAMPLRGRKRPGNVYRGLCNHGDTMNIILGYDFLTDMLVLTFRLPKTEIETKTEDSKYWIDRAGITLAEALRKASAIQMDIEYDEIQSGYRIRNNEEETCVDVYLYDSLSSGAGYSTQMGIMAEELLDKAREILEDCDCDNACQKCLKHYRNQFVQSRLDRFAALELLEYGKTNKMPVVIENAEGYELIAPIERLLRYEGIQLSVDRGKTVLQQGGIRKSCAIFPAMMKYDRHRWTDHSFVCITKEALKDAKPYALKQITDAMR